MGGGEWEGGCGYAGGKGTVVRELEGDGACESTSCEGGGLERKGRLGRPERIWAEDAMI